VSVTSGKQSVNITITFPDNYPNYAAPIFDIIPSPNVGSGVVKRLQKVRLATQDDTKLLCTTNRSVISLVEI